jgi:hypothetical protein
MAAALLFVFLLDGCRPTQQRKGMTDRADADVQAAIAELRSDDILIQNRGVATLLARGEVAARELSPLLDDPSPQRRVQAMYVLSRVGGDESVPAFERGLSDTEGRVRAFAAAGLARLHHASALAACLQTLDDGVDELHGDMTPSVDSLGQIGLPAVPALLDRMESAGEITRLHAQRALERIIDVRHGFRPGKGYPSEQASRQAKDEWRANGNYDYAADAAARAEAVAAWRRWLERAKG